MSKVGYTTNFCITDLHRSITNLRKQISQAKVKSKSFSLSAKRIVTILSKCHMQKRKSENPEQQLLYSQSDNTMNFFEYYTIIFSMVLNDIQEISDADFVFLNSSYISTFYSLIMELSLILTSNNFDLEKYGADNNEKVITKFCDYYNAFIEAYECRCKYQGIVIKETKEYYIPYLQCYKTLPEFEQLTLL